VRSSDYDDGTTGSLGLLSVCQVLVQVPVTYS
jgi:hypothetical protein